jgi:UDP-N-acetyl-D-glucosamine dehydrogenase
VLQTHDIPKIVGGVSEVSGQVAAAAYGRMVEHIHRVGSARAAELTKLLENTYRSVNIALINELAQLAHAFDVDIWEVVDAAATKPFGFQAFYPGPGVGGHCIPLDPQFLAWRARELRAPTRFIDLAEDVNLHMPDYVVSRLSEQLNGDGRALQGSRILGVGLAYKRNIADDRESPPATCSSGSQRGAHVGVHDPLRRRGAGRTLRLRGRRRTLEDLSGWELAVVLTDHDAVDYERLAAGVRSVFDTRGIYRRLGLSLPNVVANVSRARTASRARPVAASGEGLEELVAASSSSWVPWSTTRPPATTRMRSASRMVEMRCAIAMSVRSWVASSIASTSARSVAPSSAEVPSSSTSTSGSR